MISLIKYGFIRVGLVAPELKIMDIDFNTAKIIEALDELDRLGCHLTVFPEMCVTSYSCADLFFQDILLQSVLRGLENIRGHTEGMKYNTIVGLPLEQKGRIFNCAVFISNGEIKAIIPKTYLSNSDEYYEERWFASETERVEDYVEINGKAIPFGGDIILNSDNPAGLNIGIEICEDLWSVKPPSLDLAAAGANLLVNISASDDYLGKSLYRKDLVRSQSARCLAGYVYSSSGPGESSTDMTFGGHLIAAENGVILKENRAFSFETDFIISDIDIDKLNGERKKNKTYSATKPVKKYRSIKIEIKDNECEEIRREIRPLPFVPYISSSRAETAREIFSIQTTALAKRMKHIGISDVTIGISGGLDSTLALLVCKKTFEKLGLDAKGIHTYSMPGFGTSKRTRENARKLCELFGTDFREISIDKAVRSHFEAIEHDFETKDLVFENAQARERTQILMDLANRYKGIVVGTGDLSELALGWCTYNADQMSMYNVNSGIPKTLVKYIIQWSAEFEFREEISKVLHDIIDTPISPELLPLDEQGDIRQSTETQIGPYALHDFFLFNMMRNNYSPGKILLLAEIAFKDVFSREEIKKWMILFYRRFFNNQFKRSAMPDGVKVGTVALSPRGDWRMPSDASSALWLKELEEL
ncbi:MAG: NAD(+) synthase [Candidatus Kapaibacterium sp.]